ncbi:MAG: chemotaxis protein CheB, partial [Acidobacteriales bacterium]|nr:chemotaxis protein CheB [Terriglobales bacterium]
VFIVVHTKPGGQGLLARILARYSSLRVTTAADREPIHMRHIYVAPPDRHLLLTPDAIRLSVSPTHNRNRPAIDPLFESAARSFGQRTVGVVMTGFLDDGSAGLAEIQRLGGYTIVQDPEDALIPSMPRHALLRVEPDACLPLSEIGSLINRVTREELPEQKKEAAMPSKHIDRPAGRPTTITCPECNGVINQIGEGEPAKYQCQVGHSFTAQGLMEAQNDYLERALWAAVRALEEGASLSRKMAELAKERKRINAMELYKNNATRREEHARVLKQLLEKLEQHDRDPEVLEQLTAS